MLINILFSSMLLQALVCQGNIQHYDIKDKLEYRITELRRESLYMDQDTYEYWHNAGLMEGILEALEIINE